MVRPLSPSPPVPLACPGLDREGARAVVHPRQDDRQRHEGRGGDLEVARHRQLHQGLHRTQLQHHRPHVLPAGQHRPQRVGRPARGPTGGRLADVGVHGALEVVDQVRQATEVMEGGAVRGVAEHVGEHSTYLLPHTVKQAEDSAVLRAVPRRELRPDRPLRSADAQDWRERLQAPTLVEFGHSVV